MPTITRKEVNVPVILQRIEPRFTISDLTEAELSTLRDILMRVGGSEDDSRREHSQSVLNAIYGMIGFDIDSSDMEGDIYFSPLPIQHVSV